MKKPNINDFERDSHGAFGEYETSLNVYGYAKALNNYIEFLEEKYNHK